MTINSFIFTIFFLIIRSPGEPLINKSDVNPNSKVVLLADGKLRYLEVSGTPYERGLTHGKLLKKEIHEIIDLFKKDIQKTTKEDPDHFIEKFLSITDYKRAINQWFPELLEEVKGISDGCGIDFNTMFMHQLGDEYWFNAQDVMAHHCSSFAVDKTENHPSMTAQNMDIPQYYHGFQTVIRIKDESKDMMYLTIPGHLGITGMNRNGVSINCNTLMQLDYDQAGIPVTFVVRGVAGADSQKEALEFLNEIHHASGQNYMIGGPEKVHSMECSSNQVSEFRPFEYSKFTYHTNHPMSNDDYNPKYIARLKENGKTIEEGLYQCQRILSFQNRFNDKTMDITMDDIKDVLRARDFDTRDVVSNDHTYASVIYELSENPKFIIAPGKPHETDYIEIEFD